MNAAADVLSTRCCDEKWCRSVDTRRASPTPSRLVDDKELDRSRISAATADLLRKRMKQCKSLVFKTASSSSSEWMPWELAYFDGLKGSRISIMPIDDGGVGMKGQEYLELYPAIEKLPSVGGGSVAAAVNAKGSYMRRKDFAAGIPRRTTCYPVVRCGRQPSPILAGGSNETTSCEGQSQRCQQVTPRSAHETRH